MRNKVDKQLKDITIESINQVYIYILIYIIIIIVVKLMKLIK